MVFKVSISKSVVFEISSNETVPRFNKFFKMYP